MVRTNLDHFRLAAHPLISSHLPSIAMSVFVVAVSSVGSDGLRLSATFVSDDQIGQHQDDQCRRCVKTQTAVSDITAHFLSSVLGSHSSHKQSFGEMRQRSKH
jgi:hypothetical protein